MLHTFEICRSTGLLKVVRGEYADDGCVLCRDQEEFDTRGEEEDPQAFYGVIS